MTTDVTRFIACDCEADRVSAARRPRARHRPLTGRALPRSAGPRHVDREVQAACRRSVHCCPVHHAASMSARAVTAADRSASDIGPRTRSSSRTGPVRDPRPPLTRTHTSVNDHGHRRDMPNRRRSVATNKPWPADALPPLTSAIALPTQFRVHRRDRQLRPLDHGLRVRMLTGWAHQVTALITDHDPFFRVFRSRCVPDGLAVPSLSRCFATWASRSSIARA